MAEEIDRFSAQQGGLLTGQDLAGWAAGVEDPVLGSYGDVTVAKTGPWGQGPVMLQQLALLEAAGLGEHEPGSTSWIHLITEAAKLAFADRDAWYGDPAVADVPLSTLLSSAYATERAAVDHRRRLAGSPSGVPGRSYADPAAVLDRGRWGRAGRGRRWGADAEPAPG